MTRKAAVVAAVVVLASLPFVQPASASGIGSWTSAARMLTPRSSLAVATAGDGKIYALGGCCDVNTGDILSTNEAYTPASDSWSRAAAMPNAREFFAAVAGNDGRIYVFGGCCTVGGADYTVVDIYNPTTDSWSSGTPDPVAREQQSAALGADGRIYVFGGCCDGTGQVLSTAEAYNPTTDTWTPVASMPNARAGAGAAASGTKIFVIGGSNGTTHQSTVQGYDTSTNTWTTVAPLPSPRDNVAVAPGSDGRIYAIGGCCGTADAPFDTVTAYDVAANTWATVASLPEARDELAAALGSDGRTYAIGGINSTFDDQDSNFAFTPGGSVVAPTVSVVSPNAVSRGTKALTLRILGSGFQPGATPSFPGGGVSVLATAVVNSHRINVTVAVAANAPLGAQDVDVTNGDGGIGSCMGCLTINPATSAPSPTSVSPDQGTPGSSETVDIFGNNFQPASTVKFGPGITVTGITFVDSTHLQASISLASGTSGGTRDVTVQNPDNQKGSCKGCFLVADPTLAGRIAFQSNRTGNFEIFVMNADGTGITQLTNNPATDQGPAWSPDGSKIAFVSDRSGTQELYTMNANGTGVAQITFTTGQWGQPTWSPDGTMIADENNQTGNFEIFTMKAAGTALTNITNNPFQDGAVGWSPDGTRLAFDSTRDGNLEIFTMAPNGTAVQRLTTSPARDGDPEWSPDGLQLVFDSNRDGNFEIYTMGSDGSAQTRLTTNPSVDVDPTFSPGGNFIAFQSNRSGSPQIFTMTRVGTNQAQRTFTSAGVNDGVSWTS